MVKKSTAKKSTAEGIHGEITRLPRAPMTLAYHARQSAQDLQQPGSAGPAETRKRRTSTRELRTMVDQEALDQHQRTQNQAPRGADPKATKKQRTNTRKRRATTTQRGTNIRKQGQHQEAKARPQETSSDLGAEYLHQKAQD